MFFVACRTAQYQALAAFCAAVHDSCSAVRNIVVHAKVSEVCMQSIIWQRILCDTSQLLHELK